jgi:Protein of unknown function (DUF4240)
MSADGYWERIALARRTGRDIGGQVAVLLAHPDAAFAGWFAQRTGELASAEMWDAGSLLQGWLGEDGFADVRAWVVIHGEAAHRAARIDPDSLADLYPQRAELDSPAMLRLRPLVAPASASSLPGEWTNINDDRAVWARFPRLAGFVDARRCR